MKIGLLAYHSAINFGATLQLFSTYCFLKEKGHYPIIINWTAKDLALYYEENASEQQRKMQLKIRKQLWEETPICHTSQEIANIIETENIEAIIIGSDAVAQHHPLLERIVFPCHTIIGINKIHSDCVYPNAFWADWQTYLSHPIPVAVISASCQDSAYRYIHGKLRKDMYESIKGYLYLSVRDTWTQNMFKHITNGNIIPPITPDPVFAFTQNAAKYIPSKKEIQKRFDLKDQYMVISFINKNTVKQQWISEFANIAAKDGIQCVALPFAHSNSFGNLPEEIQLPLSPIDWYALIKYSSGYVGHNMHPIVVALHNNVPFYSFDNYGTMHLNGLIPSDKSSKIRHILSKAGLDGQRISCLSRTFKAPTPTEVYRKIKEFDHIKANKFASEYLKQYNQMMDTVLDLFNKTEAK